MQLLIWWIPNQNKLWGHCLKDRDDLQPEDENGFVSTQSSGAVVLPVTETDNSRMPGPGAQLGTLYPPSDGPGTVNSSGDGGGGDQQTLRNPLLCPLCDDYYREPCLLQCYHTFCSKCVRGRDNEGRVTCPLCGSLTVLKENNSLPPADSLMKQLMELVNAENPPCANCDKRDKNAMYFCITCGQALCTMCRENTHRAKMFSSHEVIHTSKCAKEGQKRCPAHGEQFIMFNTTQKTMLCVTCFRDTPPDTRRHCVDIDTAYQQSCNKLDSAVVSVCEAQNSVREGLLMFKTLLEELRHNMDLEKHTINTFCQGMQEAIAKTHSSMMMEIQRQYEAKERSFRGQLVTLGTMLPVIQLHLLLCQSFTNIANKYQFLDLAYPMIERLSAISQLTHPQRPVQSSQVRTNYRSEFSQSLEPWVGKANHLLPGQELGFEHPLNLPPQGPVHQPQTAHQPSKRQHTVLRTKAMEGEGPFSNHCRSFDSQVKELSQQLSLVKERLGDLHKDVTVLRRAQIPPLMSRYQHITGDCSVLDEQLERHQVELERMKNVFDTLWEEQLCRIHVEQDIFQSQMNEIFTLRAEVKHLSTVAQQLEPYVKALTTSLGQQPQPAAQHKSFDNQQVQELALHSQQWQAILEKFNLLQLDTHKYHAQTMTSPTAAPADSVIFLKDGCKEGRARPRTPSQSPGTAVTAMLDAGGHVILYDAGQRTQQSTPSDPGRDKRGVISQLMEKVRMKEERKKSPEDRERNVVPRERSKSDGRAELIKAKAALEEMQQQQQQQSSAPRSKSKKEPRQGPSAPRDSKVASIYHSISGRVLGSKSESSMETGELPRLHQGRLPPPPPPPTMRAHQDPNSDIRERLEIHLKEKLHDILSRSTMSKPRSEKSLSLDAQTLEDYQRISEAILASPEDRHQTRAIIHREPRSRPSSTTTSPHRREERRERSRERRERRDASRERRDASRDRREGSRERRDGQRERSRDSRDRSREGRQRERSKESRERGKERRERRDKYGRCYPASDTEDNVFGADMSRKQTSCDSLTLSTVSVDSRKSSTDLGDRKTLVVVIGGGGKGSSKQRSYIQKQRSWETFPPKRKQFLSGGIDWDTNGRYRDSDFEGRPSSALDGRRSLERPHRGEREPLEGTLRKADSFEGHEEAVRTLVEAVQKTRSQQQQQQQQSRKPRSGGHVSN